MEHAVAVNQLSKSEVFATKATHQNLLMLGMVNEPIAVASGGATQLRGHSDSERPSTYVVLGGKRVQ